MCRLLRTDPLGAAASTALVPEGFCVLGCTGCRPILFAIGVTGYPVTMTESNKTNNSTSRAGTSRSAKTAVTEGAKAPSQAAKASAHSSATAAKEAKEATRSAAQGGKEALAGFGGAAAEKSRTAARTVQRTVGSAAEQTVGKLGTVYTLVKARKVIAAGAGAGVGIVVASSYAVGRRAGLRRRGPLSRLTGGRL